MGRAEKPSPEAYYRKFKYDKPLCFDTLNQWQLWLTHYSTARKGDGFADPDYCQDCTFKYNAEMRRVGRCWHEIREVHSKHDKSITWMQVVRT